MTSRVISLSGQLTLVGNSQGTIQQARDLTITPIGDSVVRKRLTCKERQFVGELVAVQCELTGLRREVFRLHQNN